MGLAHSLVWSSSPNCLDLPFGPPCFATKAIGDLLKDVDKPSGCAQILCPTMHRLQPCVDDFSCKQVMEKDFGGATMLEWMVNGPSRSPPRHAYLLTLACSGAVRSS